MMMRCRRARDLWLVTVTCLAVSGIVPVAMLSQVPIALDSRVVPVQLKSSIILSRIGNIAISTAGHIAVGQPQDGAVLVISPGADGVVLGRRGSGPGEFTQIHAVGWNGSVLWVHDVGSHRLTFLDPTRSRFQESRTLPLGVGPLYPIAVAPGGDVLAMGAVRLSDAAPPRIQRGAGWITQDGRAPGRLVATLPDTRCETEIRGRSLAIPYCQKSLLVAGPDGSWVGVIEPLDGRTFVSSVRVTWYDKKGDRLDILEVSSPRREVPSSELESTLRAVARSFAMSGTDEESLNDIVGGEAVYPLASSAFSTAVGDIWLVQRTNDRWHYTVVARGTAPVKSFSTDISLRLLAANEAAAIGVRAAPDGEETIVRVRLP